MITSVGADRETVWQAVRAGKSGVRRLQGLKLIPDDLLIAATVDLELDPPERLKLTALNQIAADEALRDARLNLEQVDLDRFGCMISCHMAEPWIEGLDLPHEKSGRQLPWWEQFLPNTSCVQVAARYGLRGPRVAHSVACASGSLEILSALRSLRHGEADIILAGSAESIDPLFAAGFRKMRVLADHEDPTRACRPFDINRTGFVMGEGGAILVLERLSHALKRNARIYAEVVSGTVVSEAQHVTNLDAQSDGLTYAIETALKRANLGPGDVEYVNVHGTGTEQNDVVEAASIRRAFGRRALSLPVSSTKSMIGHLVNASGSVETAVTALALRDGFLPPTINLEDPDPRCELDHVALTGRVRRPQIAMKLSVAFGGHLVALVLRRWEEAQGGFGYPADPLPAAA